MPVESTEMCVSVCLRVLRKHTSPLLLPVKTVLQNCAWRARSTACGSPAWRGTSHLSEHHLKVAVMVRIKPLPELWGEYLQSAQE